ncbi:MAG: CRISPR-associated protein Cas4 [Treponema sp.]|jgi:CRISPR-associated exonuclease Cas4|nr:CRISPR-associated protein Cas4 [Treponema sp.]
MYTEDDLLQISALQHALFCERQYVLIHLEQVWEENSFTAEGRVLHERVDTVHRESRRLFKQEYGMAVRSLQFGLVGKCDLVELWYTKDGNVEKISPVEFKRGRKKADDIDRVQLCAQVLCLEEMFGITIENGQFYYLQERRRTNEVIDTPLREKTIMLIERVMEICEKGETIAAIYKKRKCDNCSLLDLCMPKTTGAGYKQVDRFIKSQLRIAEKNNAETS